MKAEDLLPVLEAQKKAIDQLGESLKTLTDRMKQYEEALVKLSQTVPQGGGKGGDVMPLILQALLRPPDPLSKIAMQMFVRNVAFSTLFTDHLAKKMFKDEYAKMIKEMEKVGLEEEGEGT